MISNDTELKVTLQRVESFQLQLAELRRKETNPSNYRLAALGFLAELDRMNLDVRDYLSMLPSEIEQTTKQ